MQRKGHEHCSKFIQPPSIVSCVELVSFLLCRAVGCWSSCCWYVGLCLIFLRSWAEGGGKAISGSVTEQGILPSLCLQLSYSIIAWGVGEIKAWQPTSLKGVSPPPPSPSILIEMTASCCLDSWLMFWSCVKGPIGYSPHTHLGRGHDNANGKAS